MTSVLRRAAPTATSTPAASATVETTAATAPLSKNVPALDGVRGFAVSLAVIFHLRPELLPGGWIGMSIFFPLSGYLITRLLLAELARDGRISLRNFWTRRARRLLPAHYILLAGIGIVLVVDGLWTSNARGATWSSLLYVNNWWQIAGSTDYWSHIGAPSVFEHLWSLSVEEQFYFVWPLLVCAALRWARRPLATIFAMTVVIATGGVVYGLAIAHAGWGGMTYQYYNSFVRSAELLSGASLAVWLAARPAPAHRRTPRSLNVAGCASLAALCVLAITLDGTSEDVIANGGMFLLGLITVVLIASVLANGPVSRPLSWSPVRWMGTRCYSLYLCHWPIIVLVTTTNTGLHGWWLTSLRVVLIGATTVLGYWLVEERFRRRRARPALAPALAAAPEPALVPAAND